MTANGKQILSIDDSRSVHAFLRECVEKEGYVLHSAYDGQEGLNLILSKNDKKPFDLILLDWEMPQMTGAEVMNHLVTHGIETPVIMLTSKNAIEDISMMLDRGVSEYVLKPFTRDILLEKIALLLTA